LPINSLSKPQGYIERLRIASLMRHSYTVEGSQNSDEAHQEIARWRILYILEEIKICCDAPIVTSGILTKGETKTREKGQ